MAIYRCEIKALSRTKGRNVVAAAAYRAGVMLSDICDFMSKTERTHDYRRRGGVVARGIILPDGAPDSFTDRQTLWNAQERAENRKNSRIAREAIISLPHELNDEQRKQAVIRYADHLMKRYHVACDYAIHRPDKQGDDRNHHAHILFTTRRITKDGLGEKTRELDDKQQGAEEIKHMRQTWERMCNDALLEAKQTARVDCRSLKDQGINRLPEPKQGAMATQMERQGRVSHAGTERRAVKAYNDAVTMIAAEGDAEIAKHLPEPSQAITDARSALREVRRSNHRPAYWLYRRTRHYLHTLLHRKRQQHQKRHLSRLWRDRRAREMLDSINRLYHATASLEQDAEPIGISPYSVDEPA